MSADPPIPDELRETLISFLFDLSGMIVQHNILLEQSINEYEQSWKPGRQELLKEMLDLIDTLLKRRKNVNIANLSGSSVSLASGAACLACFFFAPFTAGASLALSVGGIAFGVAGTATAVGADATEWLLNKDDLKKVSLFLDKDEERTTKLTSLIEERLLTKSQNVERLNEGEYANIMNKYSKLIKAALTEPAEAEAFERITNGEGTFDDFGTVISKCLKEKMTDRILLGEMKKFKIEMKKKTVDNFNSVVFSLARSAAILLECSKFVSGLKSGSILLQLASKIPTAAKGSLIGVSMIPDAFNIGMRAKEMRRKVEPEAVTNLRSLIHNLTVETKQIISYFEPEVENIPEL